MSLSSCQCLPSCPTVPVPISMPLSFPCVCYLAPLICSVQFPSYSPNLVVVSPLWIFICPFLFPSLHFPSSCYALSFSPVYLSLVLALLCFCSRLLPVFFLSFSCFSYLLPLFTCPLYCFSCPVSVCPFLRLSLSPCSFCLCLPSSCLPYPPARVILLHCFSVYLSPPPLCLWPFSVLLSGWSMAGVHHYDLRANL